MYIYLCVCVWVSVSLSLCLVSIYWYTNHNLVASSNPFAFTIPPWRLNHSTWKKQHDICFVWFHVIEEIATTSLSQAQGKQTRHQTENYSNNQNANKCSKVILLPHSFGMIYHTQVDAKQSKAKTHAAKQSYFSFYMADLTQVDGKQSKTQTNAAKES